MKGIRKLWAKITRAGDDKGQIPVQQATYLGRVADFAMLFPYGMHANCPPDTVGLIVDETGRVFLSTSAIGRISVEEGEVVFYHPSTQSKLHFKKSGDIDIETATKINLKSDEVNIKTVADVNLNAVNVNIDASATNLGVGGLPIARAGDPVSVLVVGGSSAGTHSGTITAGGVNTSI